MKVLYAAEVYGHGMETKYKSRSMGLRDDCSERFSLSVFKYTPSVAL